MGPVTDSQAKNGQGMDPAVRTNPVRDAKIIKLPLENKGRAGEPVPEAYPPTSMSYSGGLESWDTRGKRRSKLVDAACLLAP